MALLYDLMIIGDTQRGNLATLRKWAIVSVPTLFMDCTTFMGSQEGHPFMRHEADEIARILPDPQRRTF